MNINGNAPVKWAIAATVIGMMILTGVFAAKWADNQARETESGYKSAFSILEGK